MDMMCFQLVGMKENDQMMVQGFRVHGEVVRKNKSCEGMQ